MIQGYLINLSHKVFQINSKIDKTKIILIGLSVLSFLPSPMNSNFNCVEFPSIFNRKVLQTDSACP